MRPRSGRLVRALVFAVVALAPACADILGVEERRTPGGGSGGASNGGASNGGASSGGTGGAPAGGGGADIGVGGAACVVAPCDATCEALVSSNADCGACGRTCADGLSCSGGVCDRRLRSSPSAYTTCMRTDAGLACWGNDPYGESGNGAASWAELGPALMTVLPADQVLLASTASRSTCAIGADHTVRCFGNNQDGSLGIGPNDGGPDDGAGASACCYVAEVATPLLPSGADVIDVVGGGAWERAEFYTALTSDGDVYAWGNGAETPILKVQHALQIEAGIASACALLATGEVDCWVPQIGAWFDNAVAAGAPFTVEGLGPIARIGAAHDSNFAIDVAGRVWAWGGSERGLLGPGTPMDGNRYYPPRLLGADFDAQVVDVTGTTASACALLTSGDVYCWGRNGWQGDGTIENGAFDPTPKKALVDDVLEIAASNNSMYARTADGRLLRWGAGRASPEPVALP
ncbi:MAG: hypothetical protein U0271_10505 [Polyangiaceae bacterium]